MDNKEYFALFTPYDGPYEGVAAEKLEDALDNLQKEGYLMPSKRRISLLLNITDRNFKSMLQSMYGLSKELSGAIYEKHFREIASVLDVPTQFFVFEGQIKDKAGLEKQIDKIKGELNLKINTLIFSK